MQSKHFISFINLIFSNSLESELTTRNYDNSVQQRFELSFFILTNSDEMSKVRIPVKINKELSELQAEYDDLRYMTSMDEDLMHESQEKEIVLQKTKSEMKIDADNDLIADFMENKNMKMSQKKPAARKEFRVKKYVKDNDNEF